MFIEDHTKFFFLITNRIKTTGQTQLKEMFLPFLKKVITK